MTEGFEPKIIAFCCNWCTYTGADLAGLNRMKYPENVHVARVPCSGRVNPQFILRAFQKGCDGVMVCGCHPGDCHYSTGNYFTRRRFMLMKRMLEYNGIDPGRFHARWISGSEAAKFRDTVAEVSERLRKLGPNTKYREALREGADAGKGGAGI
ncbi:MAG: hydrogenase iron-sulfur subunit [Clostridiales Family XIII bacterium]|nr:hydrogenase iron-sulfur subunit [Clostridiales Family XIII bacterium]